MEFTKKIEGNELYVYADGELIYKRWLDTGQSKVFDVMAYDKHTLVSITEPETLGEEVVEGPMSVLKSLVETVTNLKNPYKKETDYVLWAAAENTLDEVIGSEAFQKAMAIFKDNPELKTSEQWYAEDESGITIMDPDGWDRTNYDYSFKEELVTKEEYERRKMMSTCHFKNVKS